MSDSMLLEDKQETQETQHNSVSEEESFLRPEERDEVKEVEKQGRAGTDRVRTARFIVRSTMLMTALAVTLTTFSFLKLQDDQTFKAAFKDVADYIATAAVDRQNSVQSSYQGMAGIMTAHAVAAGEVWPLVTLPFFESYAQHIRTVSKTEVLMVANLVPSDQQNRYLEYTSSLHERWTDESHALNNYQDEFTPIDFTDYMKKRAPSPTGADIDIVTDIDTPLETTTMWIPDVEADRDEYFAGWQSTPPPANYELINWNLGSEEDLATLITAGVLLQDETLFSPIRDLDFLGSGLDEDNDDNQEGPGERHESMPLAYAVRTIHRDVGKNDQNQVVGVVVGVVAWDVPFRGILSEQDQGIYVVINNTCNQTYTYEINGPAVDYLGEGDLHERIYSRDGIYVDLATGSNELLMKTPGHCVYSLSIYPSARYHSAYDSNTPQVFALVVASTFLAMALAFFVYDIFVQRRNAKLIENAARSNAVISSLFPSNIRDRLIGENADIGSKAKNLKSFMKKSAVTSNATGTFDTKPLADLFLDTTVLFGDIVGFTAWSSVREPSQVFTLLESVYFAFDEIAKELGVFKVETVGDCYVAVTGLPEPRQDHPVVMVRFARGIMTKFQILTNQLEVELGPDTGNLGLRIGIHSGPVTAGVLRGERSRFQLFGDTMNTTARIETSGLSNRIHLSHETAKLLMLAGKNSWLVKREDLVEAKGKGYLQTFWLSDMEGNSENNLLSDSNGRSGTDDFPNEANADDHVVGNLQTARVRRLVDWNVSLLTKLIQAIVAHREAKDAAASRLSRARIRPSYESQNVSMQLSPMHEVVDIILLPEFDSKIAKLERSPEDVVINATVIAQLRDYVTCIASMYRDNDFHNFEHASHVTMSVIKLLSRIVAPSDDQLEEEDTQVDKVAASMHDHTYGITSDPLTQFSCAFSALIHDVDHVGLPNSQLIKENSSIAVVYNNRSVAEQNSVVLSWELLLENRFDALRDTICGTTAELGRFRELIVNGVMATDIADKDLKALRNARWDKAFKAAQQGDEEEHRRQVVNRKATIVIEHLLQASDISHTMQHWHVYQKWNGKLFKEMHRAYKEGRSQTDPADFWYKGEIGFFDFYIIPLAKKLKDCGVFGKSSDEYLNYALANRNEWESRGEQVVAELVQSVK